MFWQHKFNLSFVFCVEVFFFFCCFFGFFFIETNILHNRIFSFDLHFAFGLVWSAHLFIYYHFDVVFFFLENETIAAHCNNSSQTTGNMRGWHLIDFTCHVSGCKQKCDAERKQSHSIHTIDAILYGIDCIFPYCFFESFFCLQTLIYEIAILCASVHEAIHMPQYFDVVDILSFWL